MCGCLKARSITVPGLWPVIGKLLGYKTRLTPLGQSLLAPGGGSRRLVRSCWHHLRANAARPETAGTMCRLSPLGQKLFAPSADQRRWAGSCWHHVQAVAIWSEGGARGSICRPLGNNQRRLRMGGNLLSRLTASSSSGIKSFCIPNTRHACQHQFANMTCILNT
jgi:hypothetical protein